ncbi:Sorting nexin-8 [Hondaea fermentalgiana]|uniref:Sorting nexin-8 n=1 Tax=Hondaea fermentalgiana TaxID=2315210 RepID=A0A2R5GBQ0_9STRA|nr:Sorting nexin-8 [Hondaea fermentalgiana]|eukprot:GBG25541.1 Sorting nexin-8 [Hondaea fermentalgiana]
MRGLNLRSSLPRASLRRDSLSPTANGSSSNNYNLPSPSSPRGQTSGPVHSDEFEGATAVGEFLNDDESARGLESPAPSSELQHWLEYVAHNTGDTLTIAEEVEKKRKFLIKVERYYTIRTYKNGGGPGGEAEGASRHELEPGTGEVEEAKGDDDEPTSGVQGASSMGRHIDAKRKLKEFRIFQNTLRDRFAGAMVPRLPKGGSTPDDKMVEALERFLREVARNPMFRRDAAFETFCSPEITKFTDSTTQGLPDQCEGLDQWEEMLKSVPLPPNVHDFLKEAAKEVAAMQAVYAGLRENVIKMQAIIQRQARDQRELSKVWERWMRKETSFRHLFGRASDPTDTWGFHNEMINMPAVVGTMQTLSEGRAHALDQEAVEILHVLQTKMAFEVQILDELSHLVAEVKASLHKHRASMREYGNLRAKIQAADQQLVVSTAPPVQNLDSPDIPDGFSDIPMVPPSPAPNKKQTRLQGKAKTLQETIRVRQGDVKKLVRGLRFEMDRFRFERTMRTADMSRTLAQIQHNHLEDVVRKCTRTLTSLPERQPAVAPLACMIEYAERERLAAEAARAAAESISSAMGVNVPELQPPPTQRQSLRVVFDFAAEEEGEINLREGDIVTVVRRVTDDDGWCEVRTHDGAVGLAPLSYMEPEEPTSGAALGQLSPVIDDGFTSPLASPVAATGAHDTEVEMGVPATPPGMGDHMTAKHYDSTSEYAAPQEQPSAPPEPAPETREENSVEPKADSQNQFQPKPVALLEQIRSVSSRSGLM